MIHQKLYLCHHLPPSNAQSSIFFALQYIQLLMGGSQSKAVIEQLSAVITDISIQSVQNCVVNVDSTQVVKANNTGWDVGGSVVVEQTTEVKQECLQDSQRTQNLQNQIINAISQASTADGIALISAFGASKAEAETKLKSIVQSSINTGSTMNAYNTIRQSQSVEYNNSGVRVGTSFSARQGAQVYAAAVLKQLDNAGVFNTIQNKIDQSAKATTSNPLDIFSNMFSSWTNMFIIIVVVIVIAIAIGMYSFTDIFKSKKE